MWDRGLWAAAVGAAAVLAGMPSSAFAQGLPVVNPLVPAARDAEPIVLKGSRLGGWAAPSNFTFKLPLTDLFDSAQSAIGDPGDDSHNHYAKPELDTKDVLGKGTPIDRILAYRWSTTQGRFVQIPVQVDEVFTRYLDNSASGFAIYSGEDQHTTYAYDGPGDREGFRFTAPGTTKDPCKAQAASEPYHDPVQGLDRNDEVAFMASDAGPKAPRGADLPPGVDGVRKVRILDPFNGASVHFVYLMRATADGPKPAFTAANGYVKYQRDADADLYQLSQSSYDNYGNAKTGIYCDSKGTIVREPNGKAKIGRRRPLDTAWVTTPRYKFRYDGRWLMTQIRISADGGQTYGPDMVDRFKARAFAQDPASETPCCGYEEEENNWGGSSTLLGERVGPVRAIRETWGADSGTNVIRRETFYRDQLAQRIWLRVHPIPPLDGIYAQWDFNAGSVDRFFNSHRQDGVPVDGINDDLFNLDDPCNTRWDGSSISKLDATYRQLYRGVGLCELPYHLSIDDGDPTFQDLNAALSWSVTTGAGGTIVDRLSLAKDASSPGGLAQSLLAVPYYRDDACFDDGTGDDPGPHLARRSANEPATATNGPRRCWKPQDGNPGGSDRYYQGDIATHGVHILAIVDSDNARQTIPITEITDDWNLIMLPDRGDAKTGERYGRAFEKPLLVTVSRQR